MKRFIAVVSLGILLLSPSLVLARGSGGGSHSSGGHSSSRSTGARSGSHTF